MFTEVSQERVNQDALNYGPQLNTASFQMIAGERDAWYAMLPSGLKDQPPTDQRESVAHLFYDEAHQTEAIARDADLGRRHRQHHPHLEVMSARQYRRIHARIAFSRLVRAVVQTDMPFSDEQSTVDPTDINPILDYDEQTPEVYHSLLIDGTHAQQLLGQSDNPDGLVNRWFYHAQLGVYVQVTRPNPTEFTRGTLRQATGSDEGVEAALAGKAQLNAYMGAAAMRAFSSKR